MFLCLMSLLTSCGIGIPKEFLKPCHKTMLADGPAKNRDVFNVAVDRGFDIDACNADKAALRAYIESHPQLRIKK